MFRRNSSRLDHRGALRRSKSTSSVGTNYSRGFVGSEPLTATAQRDAQIAARISFTKARAEPSEKSNPMAIPGSSSANRLSRSNSFMNGPDILSFNASKSETVADETDNSLSRQRSVRFTGPTAKKKRDLASRAHGSWTGNTGTSGRPENPGSFASHLPNSSPLPGHTYDDFWLRDRSLHTESNQEEAMCESESSFYPVSQQKLRKSRSMFTSSFMSSECNSESAANMAPSWNLHKATKRTVAGAGKNSLRGPKSMSFLRLHSTTSPSMRRHQNSSTSTQPSKLSLDDGARLKSRPSIFFRSRNKRNASITELKASLRNSSSNSMPIPSTISSTASSLSKSSGLRIVARKVSKSVKSKFKGIFGRSKKYDETGITPCTTAPNSRQQSHTSLEEAAISRVKSYVPSLRSVTSEHCLYPRQGSFETIDDCAQQTDGERSRVTSWTNSSTHTVVSSTQEVEWEPQRLSVIDEGGNTASTLERWRSSEDEERAYSALVQRLDDMQKQQSLEAHFRQGGNSTETTLSTGSRINSEGLQTSSEGGASVAVAGRDYDAETVRLSRSTASSGVTSPASHLFRTQSPYRRALRQSMRIQDRSSSIKPVNLRYLSSLSALSLPTRRSSPDGSEKDIHLSSAESVYSCLSDYQETEKVPEGERELPDRDTSKSVAPHCAEEVGFVNTSESERVHQREVSTASSVEWKTWLSAKVSQLEDCSQASNNFGDEQAWNPWTIMGHVREEAEIEPTSTTSEVSDADNSSVKENVHGVKAIAALQTTQNIVIDDGIPHNSHLTLMYDENSHPARANLKNEEAATTPTSTIRSVSSLPNVKQCEAFEATCRASITPQQQKLSPHALSESPSKARKSYLNSGVASSLQSSPGLSAAVRKQFGTVASGSPRRRSIRGGEDVVASKTVREVASFDECHFGRGLDAQAMGSKRMVELFLNSRKHKRAPAGQSDDAGASDWSPAFL